MAKVACLGGANIHAQLIERNGILQSVTPPSTSIRSVIGNFATHHASFASAALGLEAPESSGYPDESRIVQVLAVLYLIFFELVKQWALK